MRFLEMKASKVETGSYRNDSLTPVLRLEIQTSGSYTPLTLLQAGFKTDGKKWPAGIEAILCYSGTRPSFDTLSIVGKLRMQKGQWAGSGEQELRSGTNYFWVAFRNGKRSSQQLPVLQVVSCTTGLQDYQQRWADEFDTDGPPDTSVWRHEQGFVRNEEDQWYQPQNAFCRNGVLTIEARRDSIPNPRYEEGGRGWRNRKLIRYTSSSINTRGKYQWTYGRLEMKARLDTNNGCWPAWWALGTEGGGWPSNGEIDMMEFYRGKILANYAVATAKPNTPKWFSTATSVSVFNKQNWTDSFHYWRMDWDSAGMAIYLDEVLLNYQPQTALYNCTADNSYYPFRHPQYMLLNFAIGGQNGGDPSGTSFPRRYDVDYVRVLQRVAGKFSDKQVHTAK